MDLTGLQTTLRQFAAERDWQPFHTPKNLATALIVEAAELAEIFQWMTPEQSLAAHTDRVVRERIADEVADVLLYLVQLADRTSVDLKRAVGRKLVKNAKKHPPVRPGVPAGTAAVSGAETHVLVDWENVQPKEDDLRTLVPDATDVWLFHGPAQKGVAAHHASFGDRATPVKIARAGKNALDFHLSFYMGYIASRHPDARFVVVSNDKGYAPMIEHAAELGFSAWQVGFGGGKARKAAAKKAGATKAPAKKAATAKTAAKKTPAAKKAPAKKATATKKTAAAKAAVPAVEVAATAPTVDVAKAVDHVAASLRKAKNRPLRQARLTAAIKSFVGPSADAQTVQAVLARLLEDGQVSVDDKGGVRYGF